MGIKLKRGDWLVGFLDKKRSNRLLYAMEVFEAMHFDDYYRDPRFENKIPKIDGNWHQKCGDNMYYLESGNVWKRHPSKYHKTEKNFVQDIKHPYVFIANNFYYFGRNAPSVPERFAELIQNRQGVKCNFSPRLIREFSYWLRGSFKLGLHANPIDNPDLAKRPVQDCSSNKKP